MSAADFQEEKFVNVTVLSRFAVFLAGFAALSPALVQSSYPAREKLGWTRAKLQAIRSRSNK
jgi:hypothetical protein